MNTTLRFLYNDPLPIKKAKLNDLLHLKQFLTNLDAQQFYVSLTADKQKEMKILWSMLMIHQ